VVDTAHLDSSTAIPLISLEQVVQVELTVAPAGVISNTPLRRIAPTLPSINILLFFIAVSLFLPNHWINVKKHYELVTVDANSCSG
jgi:hypothetical protein